VETVVWVLGASTHLVASGVPDFAVNAGSEKIDRDQIFITTYHTSPGSRRQNDSQKKLRKMSMEDVDMDIVGMGSNE